jgi:hypothetical protein
MTVRVTKPLPQATRAAISRRQIAELEAKAESNRKAAQKAELARFEKLLLAQKEREAATAQRRAERLKTERKKEKLRQQILGR